MCPQKPDFVDEGMHMKIECFYELRYARTRCIFKTNSKEVGEFL